MNQKQSVAADWLFSRPSAPPCGQTQRCVRSDSASLWVNAAQASIDHGAFTCWVPPLIHKQNMIDHQQLWNLTHLISHRAIHAANCYICRLGFSAPKWKVLIRRVIAFVNEARHRRGGRSLELGGWWDFLQTALNHLCSWLRRCDAQTAEQTEAFVQLVQDALEPGLMHLTKALTCDEVGAGDVTCTCRISGRSQLSLGESLSLTDVWGHLQHSHSHLRTL